MQSLRVSKKPLQAILAQGGMPVILHPDSYDLWLEPGMQNVTALSELLKPYDARLMRNNTIKNNDAVPGVVFIGALTGCPNQPGSGIYETDETGECGGAVHLVGAVNSAISDNYITRNADGVLSATRRRKAGTICSWEHHHEESAGVRNRADIATARGHHDDESDSCTLGVNNNSVAENVSSDNGVQIGGARAGMFSVGAGQGTVSRNVIIRNKLTCNELGGVDLHTHVGPAFGLPADTFSGNEGQRQLHRGQSGGPS